MNDTQAKAAVEAILFAMGDAVEPDRIARALEMETEDVRRLVGEMMRSMEEEDRGVRILELEGNYQMCTKPECYEALIRIASVPRKIRMTEVLMETLAIIAYKQPVTKLEIEKIRGVKSDHAVNKLVEYELVTEAGRMDAPGRPILFRTTENFLRHFGLDSVENLPRLDPVLKEDFALEASREIDESLKV